MKKYIIILTLLLSFADISAMLELIKNQLFEIQRSQYQEKQIITIMEKNEIDKQNDIQFVKKEEIKQIEKPVFIDDEKQQKEIKKKIEKNKEAMKRSGGGLYHGSMP